MKSEYIIHNISDNLYKKKTNTNSCTICNCEKIPLNIFTTNRNEIKNLMRRFNLTETDFSSLIKICNCKNINPKTHKLCALLNILYNMNIACPSCKANYNISINIHINGYKKFCNLLTLAIFLLINLVIYGASALLVLYPRVINKDKLEDSENKKMEKAYYFFGCLIFLINTFFIYITINTILCANPEDVNDYSIDIKDINEAKKNKNNNKYYNLLYRFFRYFYKTQVRYLIERKNKYTFLAKGYGSYNKKFQNYLIKNNLSIEKEKEKEKDSSKNNGGKDVLTLNKNRNNIENSEDEYKNLRFHPIVEKSNGNVKDSNEENENSNESNNQIHKKDKDYISSSEIQTNRGNKEGKKKIIDYINRKEKANNENKIKNGSIDLGKNITISKISNSSKLKIYHNSRNDIPRINIEKYIKQKNIKSNQNNNNNKTNDLKFSDSTDFFKKNDKEEKNNNNQQTTNNKLKEETFGFNDDMNQIFISSPFHNNGK